ncbi:DUF4221 family protein [Negadavirga shengliensis]|uniref:DUF4221 family protein n=1 Tax=Negadavirga shengliensis TaxID=1389218 RepID=A0ABV9T7W3_9BACT
MKKLNPGRLKLISDKVPESIQLRGGYGYGWCYLLFSVMIYISFSCQEKKTGQDGQGISYSIDTVMIDSKDRLLEVSGYMKVSDLDDDERSFFLYNHHDHSIDEINLDQKEFVKTYPLDAEGPNGVGEFIFGLQVLNDSLMFAKSVPFSTIFNKNGHVVQKVNWLSAKDSLGEPFGDVPPRSELIVDIKDWRVMGTNLDFMKETAFLGVFSVEEKLVKNIDVDTENSFSNYFLKFDYNFRPPWVFLWADENYAYLSHEYSNEIFLFHPGGELVKIIQYQPKLTPSRAKVPEVLTSTREQVRRESRKLLEQVRFEAPVWDKVNRRYFRLSAQRIFGDGSGYDETAELTRTRVFLSVLDAEFNLVSEVELEEVPNEFYKYFAKDGKLWVCQNFSDELGFLVFSF